ncbi:enoyl-CoA hydratase/isomerase family protein [Yoonia vestfoldensis]|uniref:enoyl-CoA hydratase/isomerase family protein n=1 Tax=Yoonia vestfoldensis TaxID=245188 RepID=UPI000375972F|nr:enoyl-CoA hydratase/isomerase family protein [Yoonia vestfoldensis]
MSDIIIRKDGRAGLITLNRPKALNALTWDMCLAIEAALDDWRHDHQVDLILIDGAGDRAFCSGGDIADMYASGQRGDFSYGQRFWRDEYRLNRKIHHFPKPVVTFLHGYTMGGGVGIGCHASHRIVCEASKIAMPECSIGLVPDVGGSLILARAPGYLGTYLGLTGDRMDAGDAIHAGFADHFIPAAYWEALKSVLITTGNVAAIKAGPPPSSRLKDWQSVIDAAFCAPDVSEIRARLAAQDSPLAAHALPMLDYNAPLAMAVAARIIAAVRQDPTIETALDHEFRYTFRCAAQGDFIEGIRAAIIDRDRSPRWQPHTIDDITAMTAPLGKDALIWEDET